MGNRPVIALRVGASPRKPSGINILLQINILPRVLPHIPRVLGLSSCHAKCLPPASTWEHVSACAWVVRGSQWRCATVTPAHPQRRLLSLQKSCSQKHKRFMVGPQGSMQNTAPSYHDASLNAVSKVTRRDASAPVNISHKHPINFYIHEPSECQHTGLRVQNMNTEIGNFAPQIHRTNARQI